MGLVGQAVHARCPVWLIFGNCFPSAGEGKLDNGFPCSAYKGQVTLTHPELRGGCYEAMQEFHQLSLLNSSFTLRRLWQNRGKPRI